MPNFDKILKDIRPSKKEESQVKSLAQHLIEIINQDAKKENMPAQAILVGSVAKETRLAGKADVDIFITFPLDYPEDLLKEKGLNLAHNCIREMESGFDERYASHPYVTGFISGYQVDFVPCYDISCGDELKSAVDRTVLHTKYVQKHLKSEQTDEVLLLKKFMQVADCYGSEFKVSGFAGYLAELLILHYKTFLEVIKAAALEWEPGYQIDLEDYNTADNFSDPLVVVDPVDENRNVAAALTLQKMAEFKVAASHYMKNPDDMFFYQKQRKVDRKSLIDKFLSRGTKTLILNFEAPNIPEDALYPQIQKTENSMVNILNREGFWVMGSDSVKDDKTVLILLEIEVWDLPVVKKHSGPKVWNQAHGEKFLEKYKLNSWIEKDQWVALIDREYTNPESLLEYILSHDGIHHLRTGRHLKKQLLKNYELLNFQEFFALKESQNGIYDTTLQFFNHYLHKNEFYCLGKK
ncbi:MAG TPA: CCA tRNA nucleotidyltransferase [Methanobacteriaceae archaeon]|nr:CCA tRNA nucleotidyltransferase [Methanobacteriaceae archaeon]